MKAKRKFSTNLFLKQRKNLQKSFSMFTAKTKDEISRSTVLTWLIIKIIVTSTVSTATLLSRGLVYILTKKCRSEQTIITDKITATTNHEA
jgi:hypothetical protein